MTKESIDVVVARIDTNVQNIKKRQTEIIAWTKEHTTDQKKDLAEVDRRINTIFIYAATVSTLAGVSGYLLKSLLG